MFRVVKLGEQTVMGMIRIYFATDVHGSEKTWLKFVKAGEFYRAHVVILGGDLTGKGIVPIIKQPDGTLKSKFMGVEYVLNNASELKTLEDLIQVNGLYAYHTDRKEYEELASDAKKLDKLFLKLMIETLRRWLRIADEELKGKDIKYYVCPGNDDRLDINPIIEESECIENAEGKNVRIADKYEMISSGWTNPTPWDTPRECSEEELAKKIGVMISRIEDVPNSIFALHAPPYDTGLDMAPKLDKDLRMAAREMIPVGSVSVRKAIEKHQPLLGLHGHIHESKAICKIGRTLCVNPGSNYDAGILLGIVINLEGNRIKSYFSVSG